MAGWLQRRFHGGIPLTVYITGLVTLFCALYACVAGLNAYRQKAELSRTMAAHAFSSAVVNVKDGLESGLLPLQALVDLGATLENGSGGFREKIKVLTPFFIRSLDAYNSILALNLGAANGDFFAVVAMRNLSVRQAYKAPEGASYVLWRIETQPDGSRIETREYRSPTYALLDARTGEASYDPRTRPWYKDAMRSDAQIMTEPYIFAAAKQVGVACSKAGADGQSVFSINILLSDVNTILASAPVSEHGLLLLLDKEGRLLASKGSSFAWSRQFFLQSLHEHPDPRVQAVAERMSSAPDALSPQPLLHWSEADGFFSRTPILFGSQEFTLLIAAPYADFAVASQPFFQSNTGMALLMLLVISFLAYTFARRLSFSMLRLADSHPAEEAEQMRMPGAAGARSANSPVLEIRRLGGVLSTLRASLRERAGHLVDLQERMRLLEKKGAPAESALSLLSRKDSLLPRSRDHVGQNMSPQKTLAKPGPGQYGEKQGGAPADALKESGTCAYSPSGYGGLGASAPSGAALGSEDDVLLGARILLVESEPVNRQVLVDLLRTANAEVDTAEDGLEAVEKAWLGHYDLVLICAGLPGIDPLNAVRLLRREERLVAMPIVFLHGESADERERYTSDNPEMSGIQDVLVKPVKPDLVRSVLRHWIRAARDGAHFG